MTDRPNGELTSISSRHLKLILQSMEREQFNEFVARLWAEHGWETTVDTNSVDVVAGTSDGESSQYWIDTAEYRAEEVSGEVVARRAGQATEREQSTAVIVTTGQFSWEARERASVRNVKLVDGDALITRIEAANAYEIVNECSPVSIASTSVPELEQILARRTTTPPETPARKQADETRTSQPWLALLPGVELERNWVFQYVLAAVAAITLVSVYNVLPTRGPLLLQFIRVGVYFAAVGAIAGAFISFYMDMKLIRRADTYWNPTPIVYMILVAFTFGVIWVFYFYKRHYHLGGVLATPPLESG